MVSEHPEDARAWAEAHGHWSAFASAMYEGARDTFHTLNEIQFAAPWKTARRRPRQ